MLRHALATGVTRPNLGVAPAHKVGEDHRRRALQREQPPQHILQVGALLVDDRRVDYDDVGARRHELPRTRPVHAERRPRLRDVDERGVGMAVSMRRDRIKDGQQPARHEYVACDSVERVDVRQVGESVLPRADGAAVDAGKARAHPDDDDGLAAPCRAHRAEQPVGIAAPHHAARQHRRELGRPPARAPIRRRVHAQRPV